jgi:3'(2'), 5'-bisphosphate nucleotidase
MPLRGSTPANADLVAGVLELCEEASAVIREEYRGDDPEETNTRAAREQQVLRRKTDESPLTAADLASHRIFTLGLAALTPNIPLLSEESPEESIADRRSWQTFWMLDPLDGTREFLERTGEFTINVALIEGGRPRIGVVFEPLRERASVGVVGDGAERWTRRDGRWDRAVLRTRPLPEKELIVLSSRRHRNERLAACLAFLASRFTIDRRNSGSALKFCDLAAGEGDVYPRFSTCSEWDVAAGDALVTAAGGAVLGLDGQPLRYNARRSLISQHFIAVGDRAAPLWSELLERLPGPASRET